MTPADFGWEDLGSSRALAAPGAAEAFSPVFGPIFLLRRADGVVPSRKYLYSFRPLPNF